VTWTLDSEIEYKVYPRNTLTSVAIELRFNTILLVQKDNLVADYQNLVRFLFPVYAIEQGTQVDILPDGIRQQSQIRHVFSNPEQKCTLRLTTESLSLELGSHSDREDLLQKFTVGLVSFEKVWPDMTATRFGIRYVNQVSKAVIEQDLKREVSWEDLLHPDFLRMPANMADLNDTVFHCELNSVASVGRLVVRYGLLPHQSQERTEVAFKYDCDRFIDGPVEKDKLNGMAEMFIEDIYQAFSGSRGDTLVEWMELPTQ